MRRLAALCILLLLASAHAQDGNQTQNGTTPDGTVGTDPDDNMTSTQDGGPGVPIAPFVWIAIALAMAGAAYVYGRRREP